MPVGRILRVPFLRSFIPRGPLLPFTRASPRGRSPVTRPLTRHSFSTSPPRLSSHINEVSSKPTTLSGRLKVLIKTHGWYALGVYMGISLIDFGLTFAVIYLVGADHVSKLANDVRSAVGDMFHRGETTSTEDTSTKTPSNGTGSEGLYAMAILAYGIHKLWLPLRVGLTAAITPKFVGFLTSRGWVGRGGVTRAAQHVRDKVQRAKDGIKD